MSLETKECGAVHPGGVVCVKPVYYEPGCCEFSRQVYGHEGYHEHINKEGEVTHRWEEVRQVKDVPYDGYRKEVK